MKKYARAAAIILAVLFVVFMAISLTFIIVEAGHDCTGEDCPVCAQLAAIGTVIRSIAALIFAVLAVMLASAAAGRFSAALKTQYTTASPVELKVRLLN